MRRALGGLLALAILAGGGWWLHGHRPHRVVLTPVPTAPVQQGRLVITLPVHGELESAQSRIVRPEVEARIKYICQNGASVKEGDLVLELDPQDLIKERDEIAKRLADVRAELSKAAADAEVQISQAQSEVTRAQEGLTLARAKADAERAKVEAEVDFRTKALARLERELQRDRRLAELHYIPGTQLQATERNYRSELFALQQLRRKQSDVEQQNAEAVLKATMTLQSCEHELAATRLQLQSQQADIQARVLEAERRLQEQNEEIAKCKVFAPQSGLVSVSMNWRDWNDRHLWRVGDEVNRGWEIMEIYQPDMQVRCRIGEMDISRVHEGQRADVLSLSRPGRRYRAKMKYVEELARAASIWRGESPGKRSFQALAALEERDPVALRPGMSVDLEIELDAVPNATMVPIRALFGNGGKTVVYRQRGKRFEPVPVKVGKRNDLLVAVVGKLAKGDRVALTRPPATRLVGRATP